MHVSHKGPPAQVWLKHDLRLDDHPGFLAASQQASAVIPFFCIAPELYTHLLRTPNGVEGAPLGAMHAHGSSCMLVGALHSESFAPPWLSYMHGLPCMQGMWI